MRSFPLTNRYRFLQNGFTLVEVLVAVLVLGIGLLGLAGLQVTGLRNNQSAYQRSQATQLAYDMADRIRANPAGLQAYKDRLTSAANCRSTNCSAQDMAGFDLVEWQAAVARDLPGGVGVACIDDTPEDGDPVNQECSGIGTMFAIKIWWYDDKSQTPPQYQRFVTMFQP